jgi:hypothetical protein
MAVHPLPLRGAPGAPSSFDGRNVSVFLKKYEAMCENYQVPTQARATKVADYCEDSIARELEGFFTWKENDWDGLKEEMKQEWQSKDLDQLMYTKDFLEEFIKRPREENSLKHYYRQFDKISGGLIASEELDEKSRGWMFFSGLPKSVQQSVLIKLNVTANSRTASIGYVEALKAVREIVGMGEIIERAHIPPETKTAITDLVTDLQETSAPGKLVDKALIGNLD